MAKIKLIPEPTFTAKVPIPVPGGKPVDVEFTFLHRKRDEVKAFLTDHQDASDVESIEWCAKGWELDDAFTAENIETLCQNYAGAGIAIMTTYFDALRGARTKN